MPSWILAVALPAVAGLGQEGRSGRRPEGYILGKRIAIVVRIYRLA